MSEIVQCAANEDAGARMSIEIGALDGYTQAPRLYLRIRDGFRERGLVNPTRADFLAAVETECGVRIVPADAIVIDLAELPGVDLTSDGAAWARGQTTQSAEKARAVALAYLALAEYLDAHPPIPPVDETDVETLAGLLREHEAEKLADKITILPDGRMVTNARADITARRLLATGRVSVTK